MGSLQVDDLFIASSWAKENPLEIVVAAVVPPNGEMTDLSLC